MPWGKLLAFGALILTFAGCSVVQTLPLNRFESPEVIGKTGKIFGSVGIAETASATLVSDSSARPPIVNANLTEGVDSLARFGVGLFDFAEVSLGTGIVSSIPYSTILKIQLLGKNHFDAHTGNFSLALTGAYGYGDSTQGGNQNGIFGEAGYNWNSSLISQEYDASIILGYRVADRVLLLGSGYASRIYSSGSVDDHTSDNGTSPAASYPVGGNMNLVGEAVDIQFDFTHNRVLSMVIEGAHTNADYSSIRSLNAFSVGINMVARQK
jgi:hypothetical protein